MKQISYDQWEAKFELRKPAGNDPSEYQEPDEELTFYDNGSVSEKSTGDFIVKCDQVKEKPL